MGEKMASNKRKRKTVKRKINIGNLLLVTAVPLVLILLLFNRLRPQVRLIGEETMTVEFGDTFTDPGATAKARGTLIPFISKKIDVRADGNVDTMALGEYAVTYTAEYKEHKATAVRKVNVVDTTPPNIELTADPEGYTLPGHAYEEEGFTAVDLCDGDITDKVVSEEKDGVVKYTVTDASGNTAEAERKIVYDDRKGPEIELDGGSEMIVYNGSAFTDSYTAVDDLDGDVTSQVKAEGKVNTSENGDYTITYTVKDSYGNETKETRTVHVITRPADADTDIDKSKIIYLTFDDGPGMYTDKLLDILDKYNVKVTFFTTSGYSNYLSCMTREAQAGHTVAVHSASHNYEQIYANEDAYWADFNLQNDRIEEYTGSRTTLFRFPGGSSNTVSANYNTGIMSRLVDQAAEKGYKYFDWNVSSGDAGGTTDTEQVFQNVIKGVTANSEAGYSSIVLQHDIKEFSVNAVEKIIKWGDENGFIFLPLSPSSPGAHHGVNN